VIKRRSVLFREHAKDVQNACMTHPFVMGVADGTLPPSVFSRWIIQDWKYLLTYMKVLERIADLAPTSEASDRWRDLARFTRDEELALHRGFAARFGISKQDLDEAIDAPSTTAYTNFLQERSKKSYGHGLASLVPCGVGYVSIAGKLATGPLPEDSRYADWIRTYADPTFAEAVGWMEKELDMADGNDTELADIYLQGAQHEYSFWQQLWNGW
jgi:thiaminase (transcriptional activator TenA)